MTSPIESSGPQNNETNRAMNALSLSVRGLVIGAGCFFTFTGLINLHEAQHETLTDARVFEETVMHAGLLATGVLLVGKNKKVAQTYINLRTPSQDHI